MRKLRNMMVSRVFKIFDKKKNFFIFYQKIWKNSEYRRFFSSCSIVFYVLLSVILKITMSKLFRNWQKPNFEYFFHKSGIEVPSGFQFAIINK